jgi:glycosyltransferase involved in cell wall biosynthesis
MSPEVTVVIPVFNEERIVGRAVRELCAALRSEPRSFEVLLAENGSWDGTLGELERLAVELPEVRFFCVGEPNYGRALREGLTRARGELVVCEEIDIGDVAFHRRALDLIVRGSADVVVGSKLHREARDRRPILRHAASHVYAGLLRVAVGYRGTDTHGLKALRRRAVLPILAECVVDKDVFASELVIRAERRGLRVVEVPVDLAEKRPPSIDLVRRVPAVLSRVVRLAIALRRRRPSTARR